MPMTTPNRMCVRRRRRLPMRPSGCGIAGGLDEAARVDYVAFLS